MLKHLFKVHIVDMSILNIIHCCSTSIILLTKEQYAMIYTFLIFMHKQTYNNCIP